MVHEIQVADGGFHFALEAFLFLDLKALFQPVDGLLVFREADPQEAAAQCQGQRDDHDQRPYQVVVGEVAVGNLKFHGTAGKGARYGAVERLGIKDARDLPA